MGGRRVTEGSGETRLSDQIAYHRSLCDAATPGRWRAEISPYYIVAYPPRADVCTDQNMDPTDREFIAAHDPSVVSALLDVAEAAAQVSARRPKWLPEHAPWCRDRDGCGCQSDFAWAELDGASLGTLSRRMKEQP